MDQVDQPRSVPSSLRSLFSVFSFLFLLSGGQLYAFKRQFDLGFQIGKQAPVRVPFSWDMFATRTERCEICWNPPLRLKGFGQVTCLKDLSQPFEWELIYDQKSVYQWVAQWACYQDQATGRMIHLQCFGLDGGVEESSIPCPDLPREGLGT